MTRGPSGEWWGINNFENQLSGKSHCSQNVCLLPNGSERKIKFHVYGPDPRGYSVQASFKYGLVIIASSAATYLPGSSRHMENPVLNSFGSTSVLMSLSHFLRCLVELSVYC